MVCTQTGGKGHDCIHAVNSEEEAVITEQLRALTRPLSVYFYLSFAFLLRLHLEEKAPLRIGETHTQSQRREQRQGAPRSDTKEGQERAAASLRAKANSLQSNASLGSLPRTSCGPRCMAPVSSTAQQHTHAHTGHGFEEAR